MYKFSSLPAHAWSHIGFSAYIAGLSTVSIAGMLLGYPEAAWVWAVLFFLQGGNQSAVAAPVLMRYFQRIKNQLKILLLDNMPMANSQTQN